MPPDEFEPIDAEALPEGAVSEQRVKRELSIVEALTSGASSSDNYLEAIVRNQRIRMLQSGIESVFGPSEADNIPTGVLGTAAQTINDGQVGDVVFTIGGTKRVYKMRADDSLDPGDTIEVIESGVVEKFGSGGGGSVSSGAGYISGTGYVVKESDDLNGVADGAAVTIEPGETKTIVEARATGDQLALLAVGATDVADVRYRLVVDGSRTVGGETNSPLGLLNTPLSFVKEFGGSIPASSRVEYRATLADSASAAVEVAGRLHVNVEPEGQ